MFTICGWGKVQFKRGIKISKKDCRYFRYHFDINNDYIFYIFWKSSHCIICHFASHCETKITLLQCFEKLLIPTIRFCYKNRVLKNLWPWLNFGDATQDQINNTFLCSPLNHTTFVWNIFPTIGNHIIWNILSTIVFEKS